MLAVCVRLSACPTRQTKVPKALDDYYPVGLRTLGIGATEALLEQPIPEASRVSSVH